LQIFLCEIVEGDRVRVLPNVKILVFDDLRFLLGYDLLRVLPGRANGFPDPLPLESEIHIPVIASLINRHSIPPFLAIGPLRLSGFTPFI